MAKSFLNKTGYPIALRNNNPGNIRPGDNWRGMIGTNGGFVVFENCAWGLRAMGKAILTELSRGNNTLEKLIYEWAPPSDGNNTEQYLAYVSQFSGIARKAILSPNTATLEKVIKAMVNVEIGGQYANLITYDDIREGLALIDNPDLVQGATLGVGFLVLLGAAFIAYKEYNRTY